MIPKTPRHRDPALLRLARGQQCTVRFPGVCLAPDTSTTVWAHRPSTGKGMARKTDDVLGQGAFACRACHDWLDRGGATPAVREAQWERACSLTAAIVEVITR